MPDARLGVRTSGEVTTLPTQYATGETYLAVQDQSPTTLYFDASNFTYLRPGTTAISSTLYTELQNLAGVSSGSSTSLGEYSGLLAALNVLSISDQPFGIYDDFGGNAISSLWAFDTDANGTNALSTVAGEHQIILGTSTTDEDFETMVFALDFKVSDYSLMLLETRLKVSAVTDVILEAGWSDALSETLGIAFSSHDVTPVAVATDAAVLAFHHDGVENATHIEAVNVKNGTANRLATTVALAATTFIKLSVAINANGDIGFYINDDAVGAVTAGITTSVALTPWISVKTKSTVAKTMNVDYVRAIAKRH